MLSLLKIFLLWPLGLRKTDNQPLKILTLYIFDKVCHKHEGSEMEAKIGSFFSLDKKLYVY